MNTIKINGEVYAATKNEIKDAMRIADFLKVDRDYAQTTADIWMRSAPDGGAAIRRKLIVAALGLFDEIQFI